MEMDLMQLLSNVGVPGVLCVLLLKNNNELSKTIDRNTKALYVIAGKMGINVEEDEKQ